MQLDALLSHWETFENRLLHHQKDVIHHLIEIITPKYNTFCFDSKKDNDNAKHNNAVFYEQQAWALYQKLDELNTELFHDTVQSLPDWIRPICSVQNSQKLNTLHEILSKKSCPSRELVKWTELDVLLQQSQNESEESNFARVPQNLLRSGQVVLNKIVEQYELLWIRKEEQIIQLSQHIAHLGRASSILFAEHIYADFLPKSILSLRHCQKKIELAQDKYSTHRNHLIDLLKKIRMHGIEEWNSKQRELLQMTINTLDLACDKKSSKSNYSENNDMHRKLQYLQHSWLDFDKRFHVYGKNTKFISSGNSQQLQHFMRDWLQLIQEIMLFTNQLVVVLVQPSLSDKKNEIVHTAVASDSFSSASASSSSSSLLNKFRTALAHLHQSYAQSYISQNREYQSLKQLYHELARHIQKEKQQRAGVVSNPNQLKQILDLNLNSQTPSSSLSLDTRGGGNLSAQLLTRPDLHFLVQSNNLIEDAERRAKTIYAKIQDECIPNISKNVKLIEHMVHLQKFLKQLPQMVGEWTVWTSDERRIIRAIDGLDATFNEQCFLQSQLCLFQIKKDLSMAQEIHSVGLEHVAASVQKSIADALLHLQNVYLSSDPKIKQLFLLLAQIQKSLSDVPSRLAQDMSQQLLLEQGRLCQFIQSMESFHQEWLIGSLWVSLQCVLASVKEMYYPLYQTNSRKQQQQQQNNNKNTETDDISTLLKMYDEFLF